MKNSGKQNRSRIRNLVSVSSIVTALIFAAFGLALLIAPDTSSRMFAMACCANGASGCLLHSDILLWRKGCRVYAQRPYAWPYLAYRRHNTIRNAGDSRWSIAVYMGRCAGRRRICKAANGNRYAPAKRGGMVAFSYRSRNCHDAGGSCALQSFRHRDHPSAFPRRRNAGGRAYGRILLVSCVASAPRDEIGRVHFQAAYLIAIAVVYHQLTISAID